MNAAKLRLLRTGRLQTLPQKSNCQMSSGLLCFLFGWFLRRGIFEKCSQGKVSKVQNTSKGKRKMMKTNFRWKISSSKLQWRLAAKEHTRLHDLYCLENWNSFFTKNKNNNWKDWHLNVHRYHFELWNWNLEFGIWNLEFGIKYLNCLHRGLIRLRNSKIRHLWAKLRKSLLLLRYLWTDITKFTTFDIIKIEYFIKIVSNLYIDNHNIFLYFFQNIRVQEFTVHDEHIAYVK